MPERILVVDDDDEFADLLGLLLRKKGYEASVVYSGRDAIAEAREYAPAVIVLDYSLPDYDGVKLIKDLRSARPDSRLIMMTARGSEEVAVESMKAGASDYLKKPFEPAKLITTVENALKLRTSEAELERLDRELLLQDHKITSLNAVSAALASTMPPNEKYRSVARIVKNNLNADMVTVFKMDESSRQLTMLVSYGRDEEDTPECLLSRDEGLVSYVHQTKRPAIVNDFSEEKRFRVPEELKKRGIVSALAVPMTVRDIFKGVLAVYTAEPRTFSSFDMKLVGNFASQIALSVENDYLTSVLRTFQDQWQVTFDSVPERITIQDQSHTIIMANKTAAEMAGLEVKDLIGQKCCWAFHTEKEPIPGCPVSDVIKTKKPVHRKLKLGTPEEVYDLSAYPVLSENGELEMVVEYVRKAGR